MHGLWDGLRREDAGVPLPLPGGKPLPLAVVLVPLHHMPAQKQRDLRAGPIAALKRVGPAFQLSLRPVCPADTAGVQMWRQDMAAFILSAEHLACSTLFRRDGTGQIEATAI
jgi:hypothetical protein